MLLNKLLKIIEEKLPAASAIEGDRIGLQVQSGVNEVKKILITLEINPAVLKEAINKNCNCIITFHPLIYNPLTTITDNDRVGYFVSLLIKNSIALISIHTNFDTFSEGTSKILAEKLDFKVIGFLKPDIHFLDTGMGVIAISEKPLNEQELLVRVYKICKSPLRYSFLHKTKKIDRIAIVGGSGTSFINNALNSGAQAFITADISYHRFHEVNGKMMLIDPGHYEMEQFVPAGLAKLLTETLSSSTQILLSNVLTNPVKYYPETQKYIKMQKNNLSNNNKMAV
mgnify:CR=1 FL=1